MADEQGRRTRVRPAVPCSNLSTRACTLTSSAEVGSSAITSAGFSASARAIPTRWRCPPEVGAGSGCAARGPGTWSRLVDAGAALGRRHPGVQRQRLGDNLPDRPAQG